MAEIVLELGAIGGRCAFGDGDVERATIGADRLGVPARVQRFGAGVREPLQLGRGGVRRAAREGVERRPRFVGDGRLPGGARRCLGRVQVRARSLGVAAVERREAGVEERQRRQLGVARGFEVARLGVGEAAGLIERRSEIEAQRRRRRRPRHRAGKGRDGRGGLVRAKARHADDERRVRRRRIARRRQGCQRRRAIPLFFVERVARRRQVLRDRFAAEERQLVRGAEGRRGVGRRQRQRQYERQDRQRVIVTDDSRTSLFTDGASTSVARCGRGFRARC